LPLSKQKNAEENVGGGRYDWLAWISGMLLALARHDHAGDDQLYAVAWPWLLQLGQDRAGFYRYNFTAFELPHFIMQRRMLLGIKARAEQTTT
jgi:hypothetical protein